MFDRVGKKCESANRTVVRFYEFEGLGPGEELTVLTGKKLQGNPPESYGRS